MIVIRRQEIIPIPGESVAYIGSGAKLLHLQMRSDGSLHLYYQVDKDARADVRKLLVLATGEEVPFGAIYVGTFRIDGFVGGFVGHLYDLGESDAC